MSTSTSGPFGVVHIVGCGLLGTSLGLALTGRGVEVTLEDASPSALGLALDYDAGLSRTSDSRPPELVIIATPPDVVAEVAVRVLAEFPEALVMDVASVKQAIYAALPEVSPRFVGTHPMAGRERGGAVSARSDLFTARPWVMCEGDDLARQKIRAFILSLGAIAIDMSAREHDEAVAVVSHVPQLVASLTAARLEGATPEALSLAGAGLRDVTRIAASDPALWVQIVSANSESLVGHLKSLKGDLESVIAALENTTAKGSKAALSHTFQQGVTGVSRLPGKHGVSSALATLLVVIDDRPGELARLLTQLGEWGTNLEDLRLEHSPGANVGFAELSLSQSAVLDVEAQLVDSGWKIAGEGE